MSPLPSLSSRLARRAACAPTRSRWARAALLFALAGATAQAQAPYVHRLDKLDAQTAPYGEGCAPSLSADGSYATYVHTAFQLAPGSAACPGATHLYRQDLRVASRSQVNVDGLGGCLALQAGPTPSAPGFLSADGRHVVFASATPAPHLGDPDADRDVFLRDMLAPAPELLSPVALGNVPSPNHADPILSGDANLVAYLTQLEPWAKSKGQYDGLALHDRASGTTTLLDRLVYPQTSLLKTGYQRQPLLSLDGSTVAVMVPEPNGAGLYFLRTIDVATGTIIDHVGVANQAAAHGTFALDRTGQRVAFETHLALVDADTDAASDIYTVELDTGVLRLRTRSESGDYLDMLCHRPSLSPDGRYVGFHAIGPDFHPSGADRYHVYVVDTTNGLITLESINDLAQPGTVAEGPPLALSASPSNLSERGGEIVFHSTYANLAAPQLTQPYPGTPTGVYLRERRTDGPQLEVPLLIAGQPATLQVTEAAPDALVLLGFTIQGQGPLPSYWGLVNLSPPFQVIATQADAAGVVSFGQVVPLGLKGTKLWIQGVDVTGNQPTTSYQGAVR